MALLCPIGLLFVILLVPVKRQDWLIWTVSGIAVLLVSFGSWLVTYENLTLGQSSIERTSGLRRHYIAYSDIKTIKIKVVPTRYHQSPVLLISVSANRPPTEIWLLNYELNGRREMLHLLAQQTPAALWDGKAREYLNFR